MQVAGDVAAEDAGASDGAIRLDLAVATHSTLQQQQLHVSQLNLRALCESVHHRAARTAARLERTAADCQAKQRDLLCWYTEEALSAAQCGRMALDQASEALSVALEDALQRHQKAAKKHRRSLQLKLAQVASRADQSRAQRIARRRANSESLLTFAGMGVD